MNGRITGEVAKCMEPEGTIDALLCKDSLGLNAFDIATMLGNTKNRTPFLAILLNPTLVEWTQSNPTKVHSLGLGASLQSCLSFLCNGLMASLHRDVALTDFLDATCANADQVTVGDSRHTKLPLPLLARALVMRRHPDEAAMFEHKAGRVLAEYHWNYWCRFFDIYIVLHALLLASFVAMTCSINPDSPIYSAVKLILTLSSSCNLLFESSEAVCKVTFPDVDQWDLVVPSLSRHLLAASRLRMKGHTAYIGII